MKDYFRSLGMPVTMQELGVAPEEYDSIAELTIAGSGRCDSVLLAAS